MVTGEKGTIISLWEKMEMNTDTVYCIPLALCHKAGDRNKHPGSDATTSDAELRAE